jgi:hypothetical protein
MSFEINNYSLVHQYCLILILVLHETNEFVVTCYDCYLQDY